MLPQPLCWGETELRTYIRRRERCHSVAVDPLSLSLSRPPKTRHMYYGEAELRTYVRSAARETHHSVAVYLSASLSRVHSRHATEGETELRTYVGRDVSLRTAQPFVSLSRLPLKTALRMKYGETSYFCSLGRRTKITESSM